MVTIYPYPLQIGWGDRTSCFYPHLYFLPGCGVCLLDELAYDTCVFYASGDYICSCSPPYNLKFALPTITYIFSPLSLAKILSGTGWLSLSSFLYSRIVPLSSRLLRTEICHTFLSNFGHFLYTIYCIPFGPETDPDLAFLTTSFTSFHDVGSLPFIKASGGSTFTSSGHWPSGSSLSGSECVSCKYPSTSSSVGLYRTYI